MNRDGTTQHISAETVPQQRAETPEQRRERIANRKLRRGLHRQRRLGGTEEQAALTALHMHKFNRLGYPNEKFIPRQARIMAGTKRVRVQAGKS